MASVDIGRYRRIVQLFWDPEPVNDSSKDQPVWCLGRAYQLNNPKGPKASADILPKTPRDKPGVSEDRYVPVAESESISAVIVSQPEQPDRPVGSVSSSVSSSLAYDDSAPEAGQWPKDFIEDFESRLWMTYRSDFEVIPKSSDPRASSALSITMRIKNQLSDPTGYSSDSGWGCMIRSGQSLLANSIAILRLGRDWRRGQSAAEERRLLSLFADDRQAPYSIHNFVRHGAEACGKYPGEWFGPSATARCIKALTDANDSELRVYSTGDGPDVYEDSFMKVARPNGNDFHPTLVLVGTRLGIDTITPVYWDALIATLQISQSIGIAGGRPSSSHYFVGAQGSFLFYLDPHHTRKALPYFADPSLYTHEDVDSCHTTRLRRVHVKEMDPSMLIGFLIRDEEDWAEWRRSVRYVQGKAVIHVADRDPLGLEPYEARKEAIDEVELLSDDEDMFNGS